MRRRHPSSREAQEQFLGSLTDQAAVINDAICKHKAKYMDSWGRFKRTYLVMAYGDIIFSSTVSALWFRYSLGSLKVFAEFVPIPVFMFLPLLGAIGYPTVFGLLEIATYRCCKWKMVPGNPAADDSIPFVIPLLILDRLSHIIIKSLLNLQRHEVVCLVVVSTILQIMLAGIGGYASQYRFLLGGLFRDALFTSLGQIVLFGKLLPKLLGLLPKRIKAPVVAIENRIDAWCHRFFNCCSVHHDDDDTVRFAGGLSRL